jgi:glycosyltransferase involved in cell wall biosynthesis
MNIVIINHYAGGTRFGMEFRPFYLAKEWVKTGHNVIIVAASYAHLRSRQPEVNGPVTRENVDGVDYLWLKTNQYHGNGLARILSMLIFITRLYFIKKQLRTFKPDLIIASSTYPMDSFPAKWLSVRLKCKFCFEVHDLWPLSPIEFGGYSKWHPFIMLVQWAEDYAYRHADFVVSLLPAAKSYMISRGMKEEKFTYIPNGIALEEWNEKGGAVPDQHASLIKDLKRENKFVVGFAGSHGIANSLNSLISACNFMDKDIAVVFIGEGPEKKNLIKQAKDEGHNNVYFLPAVSKTVIPALLKEFDALYVAFQKQSLLRFGISPNKMFDYMMAQKPIIQAIEAGNNMVRDYDCGIDVTPEDPEAIAKGIIALRNMPSEQRLQMGKNGLKAVLAFHNYKILAQKFLDKLSKEKIKPMVTE